MVDCRTYLAESISTYEPYFLLFLSDLLFGFAKAATQLHTDPMRSLQSDYAPGNPRRRTTLVALQANSAKSDRAINLRGTVGLAIASALLSNVLLKNIPTDLPPDVRALMEHSVYARLVMTSLSYDPKDTGLERQDEKLQGKVDEPNKAQDDVHTVNP
ncbi:hypothetical protein V1508DRAFT_430701 [Lipomyces doorenjongii]|uniref:uncharacterized protein n=1 Tax=Lipomyces doorenjongii TaxID=383834 RepID=UPI0034CDA03F